MIPQTGQSLWLLLEQRELEDLVITATDKLCEAFTHSGSSPMKLQTELMNWNIEVIGNLSQYGRCSFRRKIMCLSKVLWTTQPERFQMTFTHEIAHILAKRHFGRIPSHGWQWRHTHYLLGGDGRRCGPYMEPTSDMLARAKRHK